MQSKKSRLKYSHAIASLAASFTVIGASILINALIGRVTEIASDPTVCGEASCIIQKPRPYRELEIIIGGLFLCGGLKVARSRSSFSDDLSEAIAIGVSDSWEFLKSICKSMEPSDAGIARFEKLVVSAAPVVVRSWVEESISRRSDWFDQISDGHVRIGGETGVGKTTIAEAQLAKWLEKYPETSVVICDINYGKRGKDWLGIDGDYLYVEIPQIASVLKHEYDELCRRRDSAIKAKKAGKNYADFPKRLIMVDELDSTAEDLGGKDSESMKYIRALAKQGLGYGFKLILIGQSFAVGETAISLATSKQFSNILLIKDKFPKSELIYLSPGDDDDLEGKVKLLQKGNHRIAIAQLGESTPDVVVIPDLSYMQNVRLSHKDLHAEWWGKNWTPEIELWVKEQALKYAKGEIASPLKAIASKLKIQTLNTDPKYSKYLKPTWETILTEAKANVEI